MPHLALLCIFLLLPATSFGWGDEGHRIIGTIAEHYLEPAVRSKVQSLLAGDTSGLTAGHDIAEEATWADRFRDSDRDGDQMHYRGTGRWHYVDLEVDRPNLDGACADRPLLPPSLPASAGPADDCVVDKLEQFRGELAAPGTATPERLLALLFVLHLTGDVHQPLHAADHDDHGGNEVAVSGRARNLHAFWDTAVVRRLGADPATVAAGLIEGISPADLRAWSTGSPQTWAWESFELARRHAYGALAGESRSTRGRRGRLVVQLDQAYESDAWPIAAVQLQRAGVRLAWLLNTALR